jgi:hypothetical protein
MRIILLAFLAQTFLACGAQPIPFLAAEIERVERLPSTTGHAAILADHAIHGMMQLPVPGRDTPDFILDSICLLDFLKNQFTFFLR